MVTSYISNGYLGYHVGGAALANASIDVSGDT